MRERNLRRMAGEFVVIVVGVLVALAVDDWRDCRKDRRLEAHLLERLEGGLLLERGVAQGDPLSIDDLIVVVGRNPRMATQVRHGVERAAAQSEYLARIASSLEELRTRLEGRSTPGR